MRVYNFQTSVHALSNISLSRMKISRFSEVNDPFELLAINVGGRKDVRKHLKEWRTSLNKKEGLLCFSEAWKNPVLWSHYASRHRGICLGFDLSDAKAVRVNYETDRVVSNFDKVTPETFEITADMVDLLRKTKFKHWEYESEVRVFLSLSSYEPESGNYFFNFNGDLVLKEVILGPLCDIPIEKVKDTVSSLYQGVMVRKARLAFKWFEVVPDERFEP
jgi:hypothetical protein